MFSEKYAENPMGHSIDAMNELAIPPAAKGDPDAGEVLRAWVVRQELHVSLNVDAWSDPATWGIFLADMLRHISLAHEQAYAVPREDTLKTILQIFKAEIEAPTDEPRGTIIRLH
jgi:hypothetical protein